MALKINFKGVDFGIGDAVTVSQKVIEHDKERIQVFEGMVIAIKNRAENTSFTVRKIGAGNIGIEKIYPLSLPLLEKIEVLKVGTPGVRRSKLYYTRSKSPREIDQIYSRSASRLKAKVKPLQSSKKTVKSAKKS
jgi:large subunit ribosomal protein L19